MSFFKDWNNHKSIVLSMLAGTVILIIIITANLTIDVKSITMNMDIAGQGPSLAHPFGVDWIGRDMFLRTMKGLGGSLRVGLLAAILSIFIALCLAVISASLWSGFDHIIYLPGRSPYRHHGCNLRCLGRRRGRRSYCGSHHPLDFLDPYPEGGDSSVAGGALYQAVQKSGQEQFLYRSLSYASAFASADHCPLHPTLPPRNSA